MTLKTWMLLGALSLLATVSHAAGTAERFSIVSNGETVGHIIATHDGPRVDIDYAVSDNGRGPKHKEHLLLNAAGIPIEWSIEGTSLMGGAVNEHLSYRMV